MENIGFNLRCGALLLVLVVAGSNASPITQNKNEQQNEKFFDLSGLFNGNRNPYYNNQRPYYNGAPGSGYYPGSYPGFSGGGFGGSYPGAYPGVGGYPGGYPSAGGYPNYGTNVLGGGGGFGFGQQPGFGGAVPPYYGNNFYRSENVRSAQNPSTSSGRPTGNRGYN